MTNRFRRLRRPLSLMLSCVAVAGLAACGSDSKSGIATGTGSAAAPAATGSTVAASSSALDPADAAALDGARAAIATQCRNRPATLAAVATLESLHGVEQLRACGQKAPAKRLAKVRD